MLTEMLREKGYEVEMEARLASGRIVDLLLRKDGKRALIEIETGESDPLENLLGLAPSRLDKIVSVALSKREAERLVELLASGEIAQDSRIAVVTLPLLLKHLRTAGSLDEL